MTIAYTLGSTKGYERSFAEKEPMIKSPLGAVFPTLEDALQCLSKHGGNLPPAWVGGRDVPGTVYGLRLPGAIDECTEAVVDECPLVLTVEAPIFQIFSKGDTTC